jgi:hypothetical protein
MKKLFIFGSAIFVLTSCQQNKEKQDATTDICSTANTTYSGTISAIINANGCLSCHSGSSPIAGFTLQTYDQVKAKATQTRGGTSVLYGALAHMAGFTPMPQGLPALSSCDLAKVKAWIDAGTPQ